jgi:ABC-type multidrug transport system fused ATPase/permease subunit
MTNYLEQDDSKVKKFAISDMRSTFLLLKFAKAQILPYTLSLIVLFLSSGFYILSSRNSGSLVQKLKEGDYHQAYIFAALILSFELLAIGFSYLGRRTISKYSSLVILEIRKRLFDHLQKLPQSFFDRQPRGRIITRLTHDVEGIEEFFTGSLGKVLQAIFLIIASFVAMFTLNPKLASFLILSLIPGILFIYFTRGTVRKVTRDMAVTSSATNSRLSEFLDGIEVIRVFGLESWSKEKYRESVNANKEATLNANFLYAWTQPVISFLVYSPLFGLVYFGGNSVLNGTMEIGIFIAFLRTCERFISPILNLSREILVVQQSFSYTERVVNFLQTPTEDTSIGPDGLQSPLLKGAISFEDVSLFYSNNEWVLKDISFKIAPGEKVGLVGRTGSGKTSIVSLMCRLYPFQKGKIKFDGVDIESIKREHLRSQIGLVSQDVILFRGTLKDNLTLKEDITLEEIKMACQKSGLDRIMEKNGINLNFEVLDAGSNLSAGERQLVSLTRIFLKKPGILILDEATANIDQECEDIIHKAIFSEMEGNTALIIAHRLETIKQCDRILILENGKLIEQGTILDLTEKKGAFYNFQNI